MLDSLWEHGGGRRQNVPRARAVRAHGRARRKPHAASFKSSNPRSSTIMPRSTASRSARAIRNTMRESTCSACSTCSTTRVKGGVKKVIFASSGATFGTPDNLPMNETHAAAARVAVRHHEDGLRALSALLSSREHGLDFTALALRQRLRPAPRPERRSRRHRDLHRKVSAQARRAHRLGRRADARLRVRRRRREAPTSMRSNAARASATASAPNRRTSVNEIYRTLCELTGFEAPVTHAPQRAGDARDAQFDPALAKAELDWQPRTPLLDGMRETYEYFKRRCSAVCRERRSACAPACRRVARARRSAACASANASSSRDARRRLHARANLAVDLHDERDLVDRKRAVVGLEIALEMHGRRVTHARPQLFGDVRRERREHERQRVHGVQHRRRFRRVRCSAGERVHVARRASRSSRCSGSGARAFRRSPTSRRRAPRAAAPFLPAFDAAAASRTSIARARSKNGSHARHTRFRKRTRPLMPSSVQSLVSSGGVT